MFSRLVPQAVEISTSVFPIPQGGASKVVPKSSSTGAPARPFDAQSILQQCADDAKQQQLLQEQEQQQHELDVQQLEPTQKSMQHSTVVSVELSARQQDLPRAEEEEWDDEFFCDQVHLLCCCSPFAKSLVGWLFRLTQIFSSHMYALGCTAYI